MSSPYAQGLETLSLAQKQLNEVINAPEYHIAEQRWSVLRQTWESLGRTLIATAQATDNAMAASMEQRARYQTHKDRCIRTKHLRTRQAKVCLSGFRYVTALSNHERTVRENHKLELLCLENLRCHYDQALGPRAHMVHNHQTFLDTIGRKIEAVERIHGLEMVFIRWVRMRAAADLTQRAGKFHLLCKRENVLKERADKAGRRAHRLQKVATQGVKDYENLKTEYLNLHKAMQDL